MKMYLLAAALSAGRCEIYRGNGAVCLHERSWRKFSGGGVRARGKRFFVEEKRLWKRINRLTALTVVVARCLYGAGRFVAIYIERCDDCVGAGGDGVSRRGIRRRHPRRAAFQRADAGNALLVCQGVGRHGGAGRRRGTRAGLGKERVRGHGLVSPRRLQRHRLARWRWLHRLERGQPRRGCAGVHRARAGGGRRWFPASTMAAWCCRRASAACSTPRRSAPMERSSARWSRWTTPTCSPAWSPISIRTARAVFCILSTRRAISSCARKIASSIGRWRIFSPCLSSPTRKRTMSARVLARGESVSFSFAYEGRGVPRRLPSRRRVRLV